MAWVGQLWVGNGALRPGLWSLNATSTAAGIHQDQCGHYHVFARNPGGSGVCKSRTCLTTAEPCKTMGCLVAEGAMENWGLLLMDEDRFLFNEVGCWPAMQPSLRV